jgi:hypothetical protein
MLASKKGRGLGNVLSSKCLLPQEVSMNRKIFATILVAYILGLVGTSYLASALGGSRPFRRLR